jgi:hypothetical protein
VDEQRPGAYNLSDLRLHRRAGSRRPGGFNDYFPIALFCAALYCQSSCTLGSVLLALLDSLLSDLQAFLSHSMVQTTTTRAQSARASSVARTIVKRRDKPYRTEQSWVVERKKKLDLRVSR